MRCRVCNRRMSSGYKYEFCSRCNKESKSAKRLNFDVVGNRRSKLAKWLNFDVIGKCSKCHRTDFCEEMLVDNNGKLYIKLLCMRCRGFK